MSPIEREPDDGPRASLRFDLVAGLTAASVVLPKAMAYATVAALPVATGLYTAFVPTVIYALLGSSRVLSVSSTTTLAILTSANLALAVPDGDPSRLLTVTATLSALVGALLVVAAFLRLGFAADFISAPVLTGFKAGIGLVIVLDQLPKLLGVHIAKQGFFRDAWTLAQHVPEAHGATVAVGIVTGVALVGVERLKPHSPAPLFVVAASIAASFWLGLGERGVATVGEIPQGLPALVLPDLGVVQALLPGALGIALMSFTETIAAGRAFAGRDDPPLDARRELLATGAANLGGAWLGAMPAGGGTSQTAVVRAAGGRSQRAGLVVAAASLLTMLALAPLLGKLPQATLAAVVIVYSIGLIQPAEFAAIRAVRTLEFRWALAACLGVLWLGTLKGILVAIVVSLLGLFAQSVRPQVYALGRRRTGDVLRPLSSEHPDDETFPGLLLARVEGRLFFVNAQRVAEQLRELVARSEPRVVVLDLSRVTDLEYSALQILIDAERRSKEQGHELWLAGLNPSVLEVVRRAGLADRLGERLVFNARTAIARYLARPAAGGPAST